MNEPATFGDQKWRKQQFLATPASPAGLWSQGTLNDYMIALGLAVCGTVLIGLILVRGAPNRRKNRRSSSDGSGANAGDGAGFSDGGGHHSASHHSVGAGEAGGLGDAIGGDSGGGGDGGGGDGGGSDGGGSSD